MAAAALALALAPALGFWPQEGSEPPSAVIGVGSPAIPDPGSLSRAEEVAAEVGSSLAKIEARFGRGDDPLSLDLVEALFAVDACAVRAGASLDPTSAWKAGTPDRPLLVERGAEPALELDATTGPKDAVQQVRALFEDIAARLGGPPTRPAEIWAKSVLPVPGAEQKTWSLLFRVRHVRNGVDGGGALTKSNWKVQVVEGPTGLRIQAWAGSVVEAINLKGGSTDPGFVDVTGSVLVGERSQWLAPSIMELRNRLDVEAGVGILGHHGVAVADVNGDGIEDIYLCQPGGVPNQLWLRRPDGTAVESGASLGLALVDATVSALFVDLDGDMDKDAVLGLSNELLIFACTPNGFVPTARHKISSVTSLAAADIDGDRRIDIFACAYAHAYDGDTLPNPYIDAENGEPNVLLWNRTAAPDELRFEDGTVASGLDVGGSRFSIAATFEDVDGDGDVDLYVANDFGRNAFYFNDGSGRFENRAAALDMEDVGAGMGAAFADIDGDGLVDLYVANMESSAGRRVTGQEHFRPDVDDGTRALFRRHAKGNTLYMGSADGGFRESGLASAGQWAWGAIPIDLDGNGALDLFVANGFVTGTDITEPDL